MGNPGAGRNLLAALDDAQREAFVGLCRWKSYLRHEIILHQEESSSDIYFVVSGLVSAKGFSADGREVIYNEIGAGGFFGEFSAIDGQPRSATIEALEDTRIGCMSSRDFRDALLKFPQVALHLVEELVRKNRMLTLRVFEYSTMLVRERLLAELVRMTVRSGSQHVIDPAPSHQEFAARIGTHREAVSKEFSKLVRCGVIKTGRRRIVVIDMPRLQGRVPLHEALMKEPPS